jgi:hypothetical protein
VIGKVEGYTDDEKYGKESQDNAKHLILQLWKRPVSCILLSAASGRKQLINPKQ